MKFVRRLRHAAAALALSVPLIAAAASPPPAATVTMLTGRGTATSPDGTIRSLLKGDPVYSGDIVQSSFNTYLNLKFSDGGYFLLRPNSRFHIVEFVDHTKTAAPPPAPKPEQPAAPAAPKPVVPSAAPLVTKPLQVAQSHAFFQLLKGGFRSISGLIGKLDHDEYEVATPVATIGIRGTDYEAVICDAACANDPVIAAALPPGANAEGGLLTGVIQGRIAVGDQKKCKQQESQGGGSSSDCAIVNTGEFHLTTASGQQVVVPKSPHFLLVDPVPNPRLCE